MAVKSSIRKAKTQMGTPLFVVGILVVGIIAVLVAVFIGKSDSGQIDVSAAIQNSNQANTNAGGDSSKNVETVPDTFKNMTNGGLVPQENQPAGQEQKAVVSEVASSTSENGTTTSTETASTSSGNSVPKATE